MFFIKARYGYSKGTFGSISRVPHWGSGLLVAVYYISSSTTTIGIAVPGANTSNPIGTTLVANNVSFTFSSNGYDDDYDYYFFDASGDVLGLSSKNGSNLNLTFSPAPTAYG